MAWKKTVFHTGDEVTGTEMTELGEGIEEGKTAAAAAQSTANTAKTEAGSAATAATAAQAAAEAATVAAVKVERERAETAEALKAPLASPALTGNPTATTQAAGNSSTRLATTEFVAAAALMLEVEQTSSYELKLSDAGKLINANKASTEIQVTVPKNTTAFPVGTIIHLVQGGTGELRLVAASGVTIQTPTSLKAAKQYATISLRKKATEEWVAGGDLAETETKKEEPVSETEEGVHLTTTLLATYTREQDWPYNVVPLQSEMWRWDARLGTVHPNSTQIIAAMKTGAAGKIIPDLAVTEVAANDFGTPIVLGTSGASEQTLTETFAKFEKMHVPAGIKKTETSDGEYTLIDAPTGRVVSNSVFSISGQDGVEGPGYAPNSKDTTHKILFAGAANVGGAGTNEALGGSSSSLIAHWPLTTRYVSLVQSETSWENAILHPHPIHVAQVSVAATAGNVSRGANAEKYGNGIVTAPVDGRLPYVYPAHQGEVTANGSSEPYAPPNGAWLRLNWTKAFLEELKVTYTIPNWAMAVFWSWIRYGGFQVDVSGTRGVGIFWPESLLSYSYREGAKNVYTEWMSAKTDGAFLKKTGTEGSKNRSWEFDVTGGKAALAEAIFAGFQVLTPPPKPAVFPV